LWNWNEAQLDSGVNEIIKNLCIEVSNDCNQSATVLEMIDVLRLGFINERTLLVARFSQSEGKLTVFI